MAQYVTVSPVITEANFHAKEHKQLCWLMMDDFKRIKVCYHLTGPSKSTESLTPYTLGIHYFPSMRTVLFAQTFVCIFNINSRFLTVFVFYILISCSLHHVGDPAGD